MSDRHHLTTECPACWGALTIAVEYVEPLAVHEGRERWSERRTLLPHTCEGTVFIRQRLANITTTARIPAVDDPSSDDA